MSSPIEYFSKTVCQPILGCMMTFFVPLKYLNKLSYHVQLITVKSLYSTPLNMQNAFLVLSHLFRFRLKQVATICTFDFIIQAYYIELYFPLILGFESSVPTVRFNCILEVFHNILKSNFSVLLLCRQFGGTSIHIVLFVVLEKLKMLTNIYLCFPRIIAM